MPEWEAWLKYFEGDLGFMPLQMKRVLADQSKEMTVPAQWPWDFDGGYSPPKLINATFQKRFEPAE